MRIHKSLLSQCATKTCKCRLMHGKSRGWLGRSKLDFLDKPHGFKFHCVSLRFKVALVWGMSVLPADCHRAGRKAILK